MRCRSFHWTLHVVPFCAARARSLEKEMRRRWWWFFSRSPTLSPLPFLVYHITFTLDSYRFFLIIFPPPSPLLLLLLLLLFARIIHHWWKGGHLIDSSSTFSFLSILCHSFPIINFFQTSITFFNLTKSCSESPRIFFAIAKQPIIIELQLRVYIQWYFPL